MRPPADSRYFRRRSPFGGLELAPTVEPLASFTGTETSYHLNPEDPQRRRKGLSWRVSESFRGAILRSFRARVTRSSWNDEEFQKLLDKVTQTSLKYLDATPPKIRLE